MNPIVKKVMAGLAIKELIDRVQEARRPNRSFAARNKGKVMWAGLLGAGAYLYKNGKLDPILGRAKSLAGRGTPEPAAYPSGPTLETHGPTSEWSEREREFEPTNS